MILAGYDFATKLDLRLLNTLPKKSMGKLNVWPSTPIIDRSNEAFKPMNKNKILFFDPLRKNRRDALRIITSTGSDVIAPESFKKLEEAAIEQRVNAYVLDMEGHQHLISRGIELPPVPTIVMSQSALSEILPYLSDLRNFTNFVAKGPRNLLNNSDLLGTISKIMHNDIFGLKKYLAWGAQTWTFHIRDSSTRREYIELLKEFGRHMGLRSSLLKHLEIVAEELLMNAIYDAPVDAYGQPLNHHKSRHEKVMLDVTQAARLEFGSDGKRIAISVTDTFGSITRDLVLKCLIRCFSSGDIDKFSATGGAGLGLFFCYKHVDSLIINVDPLKRTEFIGLIDIEQSVKQSKLDSSHSALNFFNTDNYSPLFLKNSPSPPRKKSA